MSRPFRVGIDARVALESARGWGRYAAEIIAALARLPGLELVVALPASSAAEAVARRLAGEPSVRFAVMDSPARLIEDVVGPLDLVHSLTRFVQPTHVRPLVATVHDLAPLADPPSRPELREETLRAIETLKRPGHYVIAVSAFTRNELGRAGGRLDNVRVVHHGVSPRLAASGVPKSAPSRAPALLYVGAAGLNKNLAVLFDAMPRIVAQVPACELWIAGARAWGYEQLLPSGPLPPWLRFHDYVDDEELASLYARASLLVYPSLHEGFGLPLVEAMAAGLPIACSDIPVFRELAGNAAAWFEPRAAASITDAVVHLLCNATAREELAALGRARARSFDWALAATRTAALYREWHAEWADRACEQR